MKKSIVMITIAVGCFLFACNKNNNDTATLTHCDGLVTDTAGTADKAKIYMPTAFTPNGDGVNDIIRPITQNVASLTYRIYDANNNVVFTSSTLGQGWAAPYSPNTCTKYYYRIQVVTNAGHKIGKCGELMYFTCIKAGLVISNYQFESQLTAGGFTGTQTEAIPTCP